MRAMLRANSSTSAEPPLTGSDGALTVTPQFAIPAQARLGLSRPQMDFTHNRRKTHHRLLSGSLRAGWARPPAARKAVCLNLAFVRMAGPCNSRAYDPISAGFARFRSRE